MEMSEKAPWPPGFTPQLNLDQSAAKKAKAAAAAREARVKKHIKAWGTNTVTPEAQPFQGKKKGK